MSSFMSRVLDFVGASIVVPVDVTPLAHADELGRAVWAHLLTELLQHAAKRRVRPIDPRTFGPCAPNGKKWSLYTVADLLAFIRAGRAKRGGSTKRERKKR